MLPDGRPDPDGGSTMDSLVAFVSYARTVLLALCRDRFADARHGGFHERLDADLVPVATGRKRLMVQARNLYLLSHAALLGDTSGNRSVERGYDFLIRSYRDRNHGGWYFAVTPSGDVLDPSKDLYGHAFLLFSLAWLHRAFAAPDALTHAAETMGLLQERLALSAEGFHSKGSQDWQPAPGTLDQNPHMHLLEAMLALHEASGDSRWLDEADRLVHLFQERLYHRATGTLREFFSDDWEPHADRGHIIEPGHQFEWVWLLHQYRRRGGARDITAEANALLTFGLSHGFDEEHRGIHDQVGPDGAPILRTRRIWPVAEAIKACVAMTEEGQDCRAQADMLAAHLLSDFIRKDRPGWHETLTREGVPTMTELPGSTPYHLFLAAMEAEHILLGDGKVRS